MPIPREINSAQSSEVTPDLGDHNARILGGIGITGEQGATVQPLPGKGEIKALSGVPGVVKLKDGQTLEVRNDIMGFREPGSVSDSRLMGIVMAGDVATAVVAHWADGEAKNVDIVRLGAGAFADSDGGLRTGALLASVDVPSLNKPNENGVIVPWKTIQFGRSNLNPEDNQISSGNFAITVDRTGDVTIRDGAVNPLNHRLIKQSTNGTSVLTANAFNSNVDARLVSLYNTLTQMPQTWSQPTPSHVKINDLDSQSNGLPTSGLNGDLTELVIPKIEKRDGASVANNPFEAQRAFTQDLLYQPVKNDPEFMKLAEPFETALIAVGNKYAEEKIRLAQLSAQDQISGNKKINEIVEKVNSLNAKIQAEQAPIRKEYEQAVKPYLTNRLHQFDNDQTAGYLYPGQLTVSPVSIKSKNGLTLSSYFRSDNSGNVVFIDAPTPRFGQLIIDARTTNCWSGDWNSGKTDEKTNVKTSSSQRVIDIAAAMIAGTFTGSRNPIRYQKATDDDLAKRHIEISDNLRGKLTLYKVTLGVHRTLATRLIKGNDAVFHGERTESLR